MNDTGYKLSKHTGPRRMRLHRTYKARQFSATVSKRFSFEAAHSLPHLPVGHKCRNLHGHSYVVEVFVEGPVDKRGFVVDYAEISAAVNPVIESLDHKNLNHVFPFYTTAENIADWLLSELRARGLSVTEVRLYETAKTCVSVR